MLAVWISLSVSVVGSLIAAAILGAKNRILAEDARIKAREWLCIHDWEPIDTGGGQVILVTLDREECRKCGARR